MGEEKSEGIGEDELSKKAKEQVCRDMAEAKTLDDLEDLLPTHLRNPDTRRKLSVRVAAMRLVGNKLSESAIGELLQWWERGFVEAWAKSMDGISAKGRLGLDGASNSQKMRLDIETLMRAVRGHGKKR